MPNFSQKIDEIFTNYQTVDQVIEKIAIEVENYYKKDDLDKDKRTYNKLKDDFIRGHIEQINKNKDLYRNFKVDDLIQMTQEGESFLAQAINNNAKKLDEAMNVEEVKLLIKGGALIEDIAKKNSSTYYNKHNNCCS